MKIDFEENYVESLATKVLNSNLRKAEAKFLKGWASKTPGNRTIFFIMLEFLKQFLRIKNSIPVEQYWNYATTLKKVKP